MKNNLKVCFLLLNPHLVSVQGEGGGATHNFVGFFIMKEIGNNLVHAHASSK